jgi:hypothetical protein
MSLLRRPDDHHRDLRARLSAKKPPHTGSSADQDRYLMTLSPLTDNRPDTLAATSSPAMLKLVAAALAVPGTLAAVDTLRRHARQSDHRCQPCAPASPDTTTTGPT